MEQLTALLTGFGSGQGAKRASPAVLLWSFTATLFLSALMLFSVQPMFAKMALPLLGGTPAVWAVSMCFFQAALLAGYCYAHALMRWLQPSHAVAAHAMLLAATFIALPIGLPAVVGEPPEGDAYFWLMGVLALGVGLPFFTVSASAPLLQAWFARSGHRDAADPYFLYGASNLGSLIALLAYPLIVEPRVGLAAQSNLWSAGFLALGVAIIACGWMMLQTRAGALAGSGDIATDEPAAAIANSERATWVALAAIPSGLMVAVTTYIATDIASAPFIWVVPLAMFLLTFILVFRDKLAFNYEIAQAALPLAILLMILLVGKVWALAAALPAFFLAACICHRELYLRRPDARHLTEFYIWMSAGGVLGGVFSALIAPQIFATVFEFHLLLLLALLCRPGVLLGAPEGLRAGVLVAAGGAMIAILFGYRELLAANVVPAGNAAPTAVIMLALGGLFLTRKWPEHRALLVIAMIAGAAAAMSGDNRSTLFIERSFFGTLRVVETPDGQHRLMLHGTTVHGAERVKTVAGAPVSEPAPATYYHPVSGPLAGAVAVARQVAAARGDTFKAGVVGLGTGSLACYAAAGDDWTFYDIDPMVARAARNPKLFRFLSHCLPDARIVFGDARLTLQKEPAGRFSYLAIDAFSSDAIPVHLLTREALQMYFGRLAPGGVIAIHISNRFLDLAPAVGATAATLAGVSALYVFPPSIGAYPDSTRSQVIFLTRDADAAAAVAARWPESHPPERTVGAAWTDDYSDVLSAMLRRLFGS